jgi:integrase
MLHRFRAEHHEGLPFDPWPDESPASGSPISSVHLGRKVARTPLIPRHVLQSLFTFAEGVLERADAVLDERDAGYRGSMSQDSELLLIRNASFFLIGLLTGMRCDEIAGIEANAGRAEVKDGIAFHWIKSVEHKTKKGRVDYLAPSMGLKVLRIMERWSEPLRARLNEQLARWELERHSNADAERLKTISAARANVNRLFLGARHGRNDIAAISGTGWIRIMREFADSAGVDWALAPHQLRRTYAWTFVRHRLGNMLFLKEQFKHSSLEMTQLYAANPHQDPQLYDEIMSELRDLKVEIIQHWLCDDVKLSGGAGRKIIELRANTFDSRKELIEDTAETVHIRSNGHAWCLAQDDGCGGAGLYERTRCANCSSGCIDDSHAPIWKEIYAHQLELVEDAKELGPGAQQRVERDRKRALQVLTDLGLAPEDQK